MDLPAIKATLEKAGVLFSDGLTEDEVHSVERTYRFMFPPDLKAFLMFALPTSSDWIDWRDVESASIRRTLDWPYEGICFDVEWNDFWLEEWGEKPTNRSDALAIVRDKVRAAPRLIPVYSHRFVPDRPHAPGNPVFSVYQTDIIYYGSNLENYLENEFHSAFGAPKYRLIEPIREIEFWSYLVGLNNGR